MNTTSSKREQELRTEYPYMFEHKEAKEGEVFLTSVVVDAASLQVAIYQKQAGLPSARLGEPFLDKLKGKEGTFKFHPIFAKLDEFIAAEER